MKRELIKQLLSEELNLTSKQLTILLTGQTDFLTNLRTPPKHSGIFELLNRMVKDGELRRYKVDSDLNKPFFYALPKTKALNKHNWQHEHALAQIYCTYKTGLGYWDASSEYEEFLELGLKYDRVMAYGTKAVFWEMDRSKEVYADLEEKIAKYRRLGKATGQKFHVIFVVEGTLKQTPESRVQGICRLLDDRGFRTAQFLVTTLEKILTDPLGEVFDKRFCLGNDTKTA